MLKRSVILAVGLLVLLISPTAALAQEEKVSGKVRLKLDGEAPEDFSFWIESNVPSIEGVICTTDVVMIESGVRECLDGGAINELMLNAPAGTAVDYRVIGSQGVELSQETLVEGSMIASEGFVVDAAYAFTGESATEAAGTEPGGYGAAHDPYSTGATSEDGAGSGSEDPTGGTGVLPDTGGLSPFLLIAGALPLLAAGRFLVRWRAS